MLRSLVLSALVLAGIAAEPVLKPGDRLAICGDSITEQKQYSKFIAVYLAACLPQLGVDTAQFGWSGEQAGGFANRLERSVGWFKPTVATTCYGMNDGGYRPYAEATGKGYAANHGRIADGFAKLGLRTLVIGSPGVVDADTYQRGGGAAMYNPTLAQLRDRAREVAAERKLPFADVHQTMLDAMTRAKAALGKDYHVGGGDGVHPAANGQLAMAYAFLRGLGCDGNLARIELKMDGTASASDGHKVLKAEKGAVEIESARYPFLLSGGAKDPNATASIAPFLPFYADLDRFILVVPDCPWAKARVTWGETSADFTREQLAAGINLAEFAKTPFDAPFAGVMNAAGTLQNLETLLVKNFLCMPVPGEMKDDKEFAGALETAAARLVAKRAELAQAVRAAVKPVTHRIAVSEAK